MKPPVSSLHVAPNQQRTSLQGNSQQSISPQTTTVRTGVDSDPTFGAVIPPLVLSSNFSFRGIGEPRAHDYTRSGNPTRDLLVDAIAAREGAAGGVVTASGMAAVLAALHAAPCDPGRVPRVLAPSDGYGGTFRLLTCLAARGALEVVWVDAWRTDELERSIESERPTIVWIETPSNPLLRITDLRVAIAAAHEHAAVAVVDNTFLSPALQRPIEFGADIVVHSTTKYLNGHSDVVGGAAVARTEDLAESLTFWANCLGVTGAPFDSYLTLRGLRTLDARLQLHQQNATRIAEFLRDQPQVSNVFWPGFDDHPGHAVAREQQDGFGAMLSFELAAGLPAVERFVASLRCFTLAESLGGVESLVAHPATMTHAAMTPEARQRAGIEDGLLRLSIGIESVEDLIADLTRALASTTESAPPALPFAATVPAEKGVAR